MIIIVTGLVGGGKTLVAVKTAHEMAEEGREVWANLRLAFPYNHLHPPVIDKSKPQVPWPELNNDRKKVIIGDEFHTWFDSRFSMSYVNVYISYFVTQVRKHRAKMIITTQNIGQVDIRLQELAKMHVRCEELVIPEKSEEHTDDIHIDWCFPTFRKGGKKAVHKRFSHFIHMKIWFATEYGIPDPEHVPPDLEDVISAEDYWHLYNTWQVIQPINRSADGEA